MRACWNFKNGNLCVAVYLATLAVTCHCGRDDLKLKVHHPDCGHGSRRLCGGVLLQPWHVGKSFDPNGAADGSGDFFNQIHKWLDGKPLFLLSFLAVCVVVGFVLLCRRLCCPRQGHEALAAATGGAATRGPPRMVDPDSAASKMSSLRLAKMKALIEQVMRARKLEKIDQEILMCQVLIRDAAAPSIEEIAKKTQDAMHNTSHMAENGIWTTLAYAAPVLIQSQRVFAAVEKRTYATRDKVAELAKEETKKFGSDLLNVLHLNDLGFSPMDLMNQKEVTLLAASAFAPAQTRALFATIGLRVAWMGLSLVLSIPVLIWDRDLVCQTSWGGQIYDELYTWFVVDASVSCGCVLVRLWMMTRINWLLKDIGKAPEVQVAEDPIQAVSILLDYYLTTGCETLARIDAVMNNVLYVLADWTVMIMYAWTVYATHIVFDTPWAGCPTLGIIILRLRVIVFLNLLLPAIVGLTLSTISSFFHSESFHLSMLTAAESLDSLFDFGFPLVQMLVQVMFVRTAYDMLQLQVRKFEIKKRNLNSQKQEADSKLREVIKSQAYVDAEVQRLRQSCDQEFSMSATQTDNERRERHKKVKEDVLNGAEQMFVQLNQGAGDASKKAAERLKELEASRADLMRAGEQAVTGVLGSMQQQQQPQPNPSLQSGAPAADQPSAQAQ